MTENTRLNQATCSKISLSCISHTKLAHSHQIICERHSKITHNEIITQINNVPN